MGSLSIFHWIVFLVVIAMPFPIAKILKRDGRNPFWALLYFVPIVNVVALWVWAYVNPDD